MTRDEALSVIDRLYLSDGPCQTAELRTALKALLPLCKERWPLDNFWEAAARDHPIGRFQTLNASRNGIYRQLGLRAP